MLLDAFFVPELVIACTHAVDRHLNSPGAGLRILRLVSKGIGTASQTAVQRHTLQLSTCSSNGVANSDQADLAKFLNSSQLQCLCIILPRGSEYSDFWSMPPAAQDEGKLCWSSRAIAERHAARYLPMCFCKCSIQT